MPVAIYPTSVANSFFQLRLPQLEIDACQDLNQCPDSKCSWTSHGQLRVHARSCCGSETRFCRSDWRRIHYAFYVISVILGFICLGMIPMPLIDWIEPDRSCVLAVWLREVGFTLFYGSVVLKIYRRVRSENLQEYRVRKAHHVIVREQDLLKYLGYGMAITLTSLVFWTLGSLKTNELFELQWPQCPFQKWTAAWTIFELVILLYGLRLNWIERYQFSVAVILEIVVSLGAQLARYSLQHTGSRDALFIIAVVQLHLTISVNIAGIITPKFILNNSEINRRTVTMAGTNNSGRAHPSLAKLRDNLINGTLDFGDVPISEMNPEDVRAELKRVYTQLRMYKVKSIYQENPHISKRKGGKKVSDKTNKNRRISIPPATSSPKVRRVDEEDEKSDLTVESSAVLNNRLLLSTNKIQLESNDQQHSVRV
ncbi:hypothetical protein M3Y99_00357200 [Aphelenchoides fujianensis]|nr:hypothetical protein M3Y99_00357200 [Aphelenchoides fujianensis]